MEMALVVLGALLLMWFMVKFSPTPLIESTAAREHRVEAAIARNTNTWTKPLIVATYPNNKDGEAAYRVEAPILAKHGYFPITQSQSSGSFSAGHILAFGIAGLAARKGGSMTVTYRREA